MKPLKRIELLNAIARELQLRMTFSDIDVYLAGWGVDCTRDTPNVNSKFVYSRSLLSEETEEKLFDIAGELDVDHGMVRDARVDLSDSKYWLAGHFKLFVSHVAGVKEKASLLQKQLLSYGISAFVAHEDIEPTDEWEEEILKALFSMDALVAIITPDFKASLWTDQEVGVALGRDVLVIPIRREDDPHGFMAKYQGLQGIGKSVSQVADGVFAILATNPKTKLALSRALIDLFLFATSAADGLKCLRLLARIENVPTHELERLAENARQGGNVADHATVRSALNELLRAQGLPEVGKAPEAAAFEQEVPF